MSQISASAKSATPRNSLSLRDRVDSAIQSDLHQHREHQRPSSRPLLEKSSQLNPQLLRHQSLVAALLDPRCLDALGDDSTGILEERVGFTFADDKAARDNLRVADERPGLPADSDDRDDDAVAGEMPSVAQYFVADFTHAGHVDQHAAGGRLVGNSCAV